MQDGTTSRPPSGARGVVATPSLAHRTKGMIPRAMGTGRNARAFRTAARRGRSQGGGGGRRSKSAARRHLEREGVDLELGCEVTTGQLEPVVLRGICQLFARARAFILH